MTTVLYSIDGGSFEHATVKETPTDADHAAQLVAENLTAQGAPARGEIRVHRITRG